MTKEQEKTPLERLTFSRYMLSIHERFGRRLVFEEHGKMRLTHTIGWILGISHYNKEKAEELATKFCKVMDRLADYGGDIESPEGNTDHEGKLLTFPGYKIVLSDDGTHAGFSLLWYRAIFNKQIREYAQEMFPAEHNNGSCMATDSETFKALRIRKDLEDYRIYRPTWATSESTTMYYEWVQYAFSFNGGLIYHSNRDDLTNGDWSTHT